MILDLSMPEDKDKAIEYFESLIGGGFAIELKKIYPHRSNKQNRYLHALFALFGNHLGYNIEEIKTIVKRELGYIYEKNGTKFLRHTSEMDTKTLSEFIDRFRNYSAHEGLYLPTAEEFDENYIAMMKEVERIESQMKRYAF